MQEGEGTGFPGTQAWIWKASLSSAQTEAPSPSLTLSLHLITPSSHLLSWPCPCTHISGTGLGDTEGNGRPRTGASLPPWR